MHWMLVSFSLLIAATIFSGTAALITLNPFACWVSGFAFGSLVAVTVTTVALWHRQKRYGV